MWKDVAVSETQLLLIGILMGWFVPNVMLVFWGVAWLLRDWRLQKAMAADILEWELQFMAEEEIDGV
jgi:hypothetical protein